GGIVRRRRRILEDEEHVPGGAAERRPAIEAGAGTGVHGGAVARGGRCPGASNHGPEAPRPLRQLVRGRGRRAAVAGGAGGGWRREAVPGAPGGRGRRAIAGAAVATDASVGDGGVRGAPGRHQRTT